MSAIKLVCFDLGGVLVRICRSWEEATQHAELPLREPQKLMSDEWISRRRQVVMDYQMGNMSCAEYRQQMSDATNGLYSAEEVARIHDSWTLDQYDDVEPLIDELNASANVTTACLSNTNHAHWVRLVGEAEPLEYPAVPKLRHQLASHLMKTAKPDPSIYAQAQQTFACSPEQILFFDDLAENIGAAKSAGWNAEQVDYREETVPQMRAYLASYGVVGS